MAAADDPLISSRARRRFLLALCYGATNLALAGLIGWRARPTTLTLDETASGGPLGALRRGLPPAMNDAPPQPPAGHSYEIVVANGRVIDPASGFDQQATVGIDGSTITAISAEPLDGELVIDASGRVVAPGFVDLLSYEPNPLGAWYKLADGVTTNLAMHGVSNYAEPFFERYEGASPIHFGGAFHHQFMRAADVGAAADEPLRASQLEQLRGLLSASLRAGLAGACFAPEYAPGTTLEEMVALAGEAAAVGHTAFFHARHSDPHPPGTGVEAVAEVLEVARRSGAPVHIEHLTSTGGTYAMAQVLAMIDQARAEGLDVTACLYPYDFWGTFLASTRFAPGWRERYGLDYSDLQVAGTERRLSAATFDAAVDQNLLVAALGSIPESEIQLALGRPWMMVASDAILQPDLNNHPRASGTFARTLGRYVRELGVLDLPTALAKMTILPAQRVATMIPAMARKGRLQRGADADLVVLDPATISDRATVADPASTSVGIDWVLVDGQVALWEGTAQRNVRAGRALRASVE